MAAATFTDEPLPLLPPLALFWLSAVEAWSFPLSIS